MEPTPSQQPPKNNLLDQTQQQVNEVVGIMRVNVEKVLERDTKLSELDSRADALQEGGKRFEQQAQKLKRKYWWKNLKMMIILGVIGIIILIIIIGKWILLSYLVALFLELSYYLFTYLYIIYKFSHFVLIGFVLNLHFYQV